MQADPQKTAQFRVGSAVVAACVRSGACNTTDPDFRNFTLLWSKNMEHTWAHDTKSLPANYQAYAGPDVVAAMTTLPFLNTIEGYLEQRRYGLQYSLDALPPGHALRHNLTAAFAQTVAPSSPPDPTSDGWTAAEFGRAYDTGRYMVAFDKSKTGAGMTLLIDAVTGVSWVDQSRGAEVIGLPTYLTYTEQDYRDFIADYTWYNPVPSWFYLDVGRANVSIYAPEAIHQLVSPSPIGLWTRNTTDTQEFLLQAAFAPFLNQYYGSCRCLVFRLLAHVVVVGVGLMLVCCWCVSHSSRIAMQV